MGLFGGKKIKDPVAGTAHVVGVAKPIERARYVNCKLDLVVQGPGMAPFQGVAKKKACRWDRVPQTGATIPVVIDRSDPQIFEVAWDELPTHDEVVAHRSEQLIAGHGIESADASTAAVQQSFPGAHITVEGDTASSGNSRIAQLERLAGLHRAGVLTDAEFAAEKTRLLNS